MTSLHVLDSVKGLTPLGICRHLHQLAASVPAGQAIVELGVFKGRTACWLGAGAQSGQGAHVWAIDPWDLPGDRRPFLPGKPGKKKHRGQFTVRETRLAAKRNLHRAGLRSHVTLVRDFSVPAGRSWTGPQVGLLYVDGDHHTDAVLADFRAWRPHMTSGAVVAFDDHVSPNYQDVVDAVAELARAGMITRPELVEDRLAVARVV